MLAMTGAAPPSWAWPKASRTPWSERNLPSAPCTPSDTTTEQYPYFLTMASTLARNFAWSKGTSGNRMTMGSSQFLSEAKPPAAAIHPAWRPITSTTNTLVEVLAIDATSKLASRTDTATYFATEPKPGQQSVMGMSLSTVLGTWMACSG